MAKYFINLILACSVMTLVVLGLLTVYHHDEVRKAREKCEVAARSNHAYRVNYCAPYRGGPHL